jgi:hypothetical protein
MLRGKKFGCIALLAVASVAFAGAQNDYRWDAGHRDWHPKPACKLRVVDVYQPMGGKQPVHLKIVNESAKAVKYDVAIRVNQTNAGSISVDHANVGETSDRDSNMGYNGTLPGSRIELTVTNCILKG